MHSKIYITRDLEAPECTARHERLDGQQRMYEKAMASTRTSAKLHIHGSTTYDMH